MVRAARMRASDLAGFEAKFEATTDPWSTWTDRDEALKRTAILHAMPAAVSGRVLELGAGNGSNSQALACRALRLDATEATGEGTRLVARAITGRGSRARAIQLAVPAAFPRPAYDAIIVAELLYYLDRTTMASLAGQISRALRPGGTLVLAHHRVTFYDFAQHAEGIQRRLLDQTRADWLVRTVRRTGRWSVLSCTKGIRQTRADDGGA
jgi:cyclopropane fatty-acyl-phospholipid synthase-like methyltransferase